MSAKETLQSEVGMKEAAAVFTFGTFPEKSSRFPLLCEMAGNFLLNYFPIFQCGGCLIFWGEGTSCLLKELSESCFSKFTQP